MRPKDPITFATGAPDTQAGPSLHEAYLPRYSRKSVKTVAISMLGLAVVNSLITLLPFMPTFEPKRGLVGLSIAIFGALALYSIQRDRVDRAVFIICGGLLAAVALFQVTVGNGVRAPLNASVCLLIPFAGLILGRRASMLALVVALSWLSLVLAAELMGWIPGMNGSNIPVLFPAFWLYCALCVAMYAITDNYSSVVARAVNDLIAEQDARGSAEIGKAQAEAVVRYKDEFMAMLSHEIRTPLAGVSSGIQLLSHPNATDAMRSRAFLAVRQAVENATEVLNNLLENSRIDAGKLELNPGAVCVADVLSGVERVFGVHAEAKGLQLKIELDQVPTEALMLDGPRLTQMLSNLVGNAIKFTREGSVTLRAEGLQIAAAQLDPRRHVVSGNGTGTARRGHVATMVEREAGRGPNVLRFSVVDTGPGISPDNQRKLFQEFVQIRESGYTNLGTGLGLVVVRKLAVLMGGTVGVESREGEGSRFWFTVALDQA